MAYSLLIVEYIVTFTDYYSTNERGILIKDALVNVSTSWKELQRENPASRFPSDFSLLEVCLYLESLSCFAALQNEMYIVKAIIKSSLECGKRMGSFLLALHLCAYLEVHTACLPILMYSLTSY